MIYRSNSDVGINGQFMHFVVDGFGIVYILDLTILHMS